MDMLTRRHSPLDYSPETAHTIEVSREEDENGKFGSFGFTLLNEKPPNVGTIVPGGPAEKAGLKQGDIVLSVNGIDVASLPHQKVVGIIAQTPTAGVWLKVCDPATKSSFSSNSLGNSLAFSSSMSTSTPNFPRGLPSGGAQRRTAMRGVGGAVWEPPPKYSELPPNRGRGPGSPQMGNRGSVVSASMANISPLNRKVLVPHSKASPAGQLFPNGYSPSPPQQSPANNCYTSASVMVLYIGPVEIPETWSMRGISSKCIQECTRRLLSQRQEFIEAFLEVSTNSMKVLNVSRNVLYRHKREELFYCGTCTDDEQYFAIVTRRIDPKMVDPEVGQTVHVPVERPVKAHICHVFQVIRNKSILVLHAGDKGTNGEAPNVKPKTVQILSCLTIIKAIEALFIGEATGGAVSSAVLIGESGLNSSNTSFRSIGSAESNNGSSDSFSSFPDKSKKKKDVVDLRPAAFNQLNSNPSSSSLTFANPTYGTPEPMSRGRDYLHPMDTPAFGAMASSGRSWYKVDSPKESLHSRQWSFDSVGGQHGSRPDSGNFSDARYEASSKRELHQQEGRRGAFDKVKKISDESSLSSHSSGGRAASPNKLGHRSRASHSPSPSKSLSHSSGSRSRSPSPSHSKFQQRKSPSPIPMSQTCRRIVMSHRAPSMLSAGMALEVPRSGALSPTSTLDSASRYRTTLRRQGSDSSIMDIHQVDTMRSGTGLPAKNGVLSSSQGSMMTVTTLAEEEVKEEEVGRVGGWIASFDKLLEDPLGVVCLQQFLEKEHCEENILFWKDAQEFSERSPKMTNIQIQAAAKKIYDQYLSPSSPHTVNVDDRAVKVVEARLNNPTPHLFAEAKEQIYQLLKMDCYMRFKRSDLVKECLLADMEGGALPIGPAPVIPKNPWRKQKEQGFSKSFFGRFGRNRAPPSPPLTQGPNKTKKDSKSSLRDSPSSRKTSRDTKAEKRQSGSDAPSPAEEFPPERHLDILQAHKGNIFEVNLPNKVTKIMEVPKKGTVRDAIGPVLKKNNYSLDVMDLKFADTLKPVSLDSPAQILIGQHIIVLKSAQTFVAVFPDGPEHILPADKTPVQDLVARVLHNTGKLQSFAVYLENSRVPFNSTVEASTLVGQKVTVKYLGGQYVPADNNMDDLFSMIQRLAGDTLEDQRTSPTPRNTPEPGQLSSGGAPPPEGRPRGSSFRGSRLSPRSSDSSPETRSKKKPLTASHSIGGFGSVDRKFKRTQSGAAISKRQKAPKDVKRSLSPPTVTSNRTSPSSHHQANRAHRSSEELLQESRPASGPKYFPPAYPTIDQTGHLSQGNSAYGNIPLIHGKHGRSSANNSDPTHPLDSFVNEASVGLPSGAHVTTTSSHGRQHSMPVQMPPEGYVSNYPWHHAQPPNPRRYTHQQARTAAQRHHLTQNPELMQTGDKLVQREIDDYRHNQLTFSYSSDGSNTSAEHRAPLSPTTHTLLLPEDSDRQRETFV